MKKFLLLIPLLLVLVGGVKKTDTPPYAYNVKWKGAKGDSTTSDHAAFVNAMAAMPDSGGVLFIPPGNYLIDSILPVSKNNITFLGGGWNTKIKIADDTVHILVSGKNGVKFKDLQVTGTSTTYIAAGMLYGLTANDLTLDNVSFRGGGTQLRMHTVTNFRIADCKFDSLTSTGSGKAISLWNCSNGTIVNADVGDFIQASGSPRAVYIQSSDHVSVINPYIHDIDFSQCTNAAGVSFSDETSYSSLTGGTIEGLLGGDGVLTEAGAHHITITGVVSSGNHNDVGVGTSSGTGDGLDIFNSSYVTVSNCIFTNNGNDATYLRHPGIEVWGSDYVKISNTQANDNGAYGVQVINTPNLALHNVEASGNYYSGMHVNAEVDSVKCVNDSIVVREYGSLFGLGWRRGSIINIDGTDYLIDTVIHGDTLYIQDVCTDSAVESYVATRNLQVVGGDFSNNNRGDNADVWHQNGIYLGSMTHGIITGIAAKDFDTTGAKLQEYGIRLENQAQAVMLANELLGNATGGTLDSPDSSLINLVDGSHWKIHDGDILVINAAATDTTVLHPDYIFSDSLYRGAKAAESLLATVQFVRDSASGSSGLDSAEVMAIIRDTLSSATGMNDGDILNVNVLNADTVVTDVLEGSGTDSLEVYFEGGNDSANFFFVDLTAGGNDSAKFRMDTGGGYMDIAIGAATAGGLDSAEIMTVVRDTLSSATGMNDGDILNVNVLNADTVQTGYVGTVGLGTTDIDAQLRLFTDTGTAVADLALPFDTTGTELSGTEPADGDVWSWDAAADRFEIKGQTGGSGTADSTAVDTSGGGVYAYVYSTAGAALTIREGANIDLTVDTDTLYIAGPAASGTADSMAIDTSGAGVYAYLYSTTAAAATFREGTGIDFTADTDTGYISIDGTVVDTVELNDSLEHYLAREHFDDSVTATTAKIPTAALADSALKVDTAGVTWNNAAHADVADSALKVDTTGVVWNEAAHAAVADSSTDVDTTNGNVVTFHNNNDANTQNPVTVYKDSFYVLYEPDVASETSEWHFKGDTIHIDTGDGGSGFTSLSADTTDNGTPDLISTDSLALRAGTNIDFSWTNGSDERMLTISGSGGSGDDYGLNFNGTAFADSIWLKSGTGIDFTVDNDTGYIAIDGTVVDTVELNDSLDHYVSKLGATMTGDAANISNIHLLTADTITFQELIAYNGGSNSDTIFEFTGTGLKITSPGHVLTFDTTSIGYVSLAVFADSASKVDTAGVTWNNAAHADVADSALKVDTTGVVWNEAAHAAVADSVTDVDTTSGNVVTFHNNNDANTQNPVTVYKDSFYVQHVNGDVTNGVDGWKVKGDTIYVDTADATGAGGSDTSLMLGDATGSPTDTAGWYGDTLYVNSSNDTTWMRSGDAFIGVFDKIGDGATMIEVTADSIKIDSAMTAGRISTDSIYISGVWINDFEGTGLSVTSGVLNATAGGTFQAKLAGQAYSDSIVFRDSASGDIRTGFLAGTGLPDTLELRHNDGDHDYSGDFLGLTAQASDVDTTGTDIAAFITNQNNDNDTSNANVRLHIRDTVGVSGMNLTAPVIATSIDLPTGAVNAAGEISNAVIDPPHLNASVPSVGDVPAYATATTWSWVTPSLSTHDHDATYATLAGETGYSSTHDFSSASLTLATEEIIPADVDLSLTSWDFGGANDLEIPNAADPTTDVQGELAWNQADSMLEIHNGNASIGIATGVKMAAHTIDDPDGLVYDTVVLLPVLAAVFPHGITITGCGMARNDATRDSCTFYEMTDPATVLSTIETLGGSTDLEFEDDGTLADASIAAGNLVGVLVTDQDCDTKTHWVTFTINDD